MLAGLALQLHLQKARLLFGRKGLLGCDSLHVLARSDDSRGNLTLSLCSVSLYRYALIC